MRIGEIVIPWFLIAFVFAYAAIQLGFMHSRIKRRMVCKRRGQHRWALSLDEEPIYCADCFYEPKGQ